jgi:hypothetical protein
VPFIGDMGDLAPDQPKEVALKRHLLLPGLLITVAEALVVVLPLWVLFELSTVPPSVLLRIVLPVFAGMAVIWAAVSAIWIAPVHRAVQAVRRGQRLDGDLADAAHRATLQVPRRGASSPSRPAAGISPSPRGA